MAETVSITFQFAIGDAVTHRLAMNAKKTPFKSVVVERVVNQCYGGTQILYQVRQVDSAGLTNLFCMTEPELTAYPSQEELDAAEVLEEERQTAFWKARAAAKKASETAS